MFSEGPRPNFYEAIAARSGGRWSASPRFAPLRTYEGRDPRAVLADAPFTAQDVHKYQPHLRSRNNGPRAFSSLGIGDEAELQQPRLNGAHQWPPLAPPPDMFRIGTIVKEPGRPNAMFVSELPRLTREKPLEPFRRKHYGVELNAGMLSSFTVRSPSQVLT